jgi:TRAP transporter 4TM/12TM fusion protein
MMHTATLDRSILWLVAALAGSLSVFQLWYGIDGSLSATYLRPIHLGWILVLVLLRFPLCNPVTKGYLPSRLLDVLLVLAVLASAWVVLRFDYAGIDHILYGLNATQQVAGAVLLLATLECTRRAVGWEMALIGLLFVLYVLFGDMLPDALANRGFTVERLLRFQTYTTEGVFGAPLGIAASTVFLFVLFGAFLEITGAGKFFIDLSYAAAGKYRGGPAKAAVLASAAMGSISGSAIANAVTSGAFTIPMMKKLGYKPEQAAGIEAAASTGGQIMPPIMGAGAFIMAEYTNTPYSTIVLVSIAPAMLYFLGTLLYVHLMALKLGLQGMSDTPPLKDTLKYGFHFIAPLALVTGLLLMNYSPALVGVIGCGAVLLAAMLRPHTRLNLRTLWQALQAGALMMLPISAACATAGIVVGALGQTGMGLEFTRFVVSLADGQVWLALLLVGAAAMILGMGLPVTAAYILLAVMAAPALENLGVPLLVAHLVIFWLSQTSNVTPPVALAAFAAAGVAGARPMRSAVEGAKLAKGLFIIPGMMVYSDLIWLDDVTWHGFLLGVALTMAVLAAFAFIIENRIFCGLHSLERLFFVLAIGLMLYHDALISGIGLACFAVACTSNALRMNRKIR